VRPMIHDGLAEASRDTIERLIPARVAAADPRVEQASVARERFAKRCPLRAEPAGVGGVLAIAGDGTIRSNAQAAADAAIGAGRAGHAAWHCGSAAPRLASVSAIATPSTCGRAARSATAWPNTS